MRISDWSSDVCSSDLVGLGKTISTFATAARGAPLPMAVIVDPNLMKQWERKAREFTHYRVHAVKKTSPYTLPYADLYIFSYTHLFGWLEVFATGRFKRSEEHTSELQSLMRISYAVFCLNSNTARSTAF